MATVLFSEAYDILPQLLAEARREAGVSQRGLARLMGRSASHIHKIETRQRRVEVIEFCRYIEALGGDPIATLHQLRDQMARKGCTPERELSSAERARRRPDDADAKP